MKRSALIAIVVVGLIAQDCTKQTVAPTTGTTSVTVYLDKMIQIMQENSINRNKIDWDAFKSAVYDKLDTVKHIAYANDAITLALQLLGDNTSSVVTAVGEVLVASPACTDDTPPEVVTDPLIGYVSVPSTNKSGVAAAVFSEGIQNGVIKPQDNADLKGWIVDLRGNGGGNMWPMLAAVGPILGSDTLGYFIQADDSKTAFRYSGGTTYFGADEILHVAFPYSIKSKTAKVALLIDHATSTSAETIAIAFVGKPNTKIFGAATCGKSKATQTFILADKLSVMYLTTANLSDRNNKVYNGGLVPDVEVSDRELIYSTAVDWINQ